MDENEIKLTVLKQVLEKLCYVRDVEDEGLRSLEKHLIEWRDSLQAVKH